MPDIERGDPLAQKMPQDPFFTKESQQVYSDSTNPSKKTPQKAERAGCRLQQNYRRKKVVGTREKQNLDGHRDFPDSLSHVDEAEAAEGLRQR